MVNKQTKLMGLFFILLVSFTIAATFVDYDSSSFNDGTYVNTHFNSTSNSVELNDTFTTGNYTSEEFDGVATDAVWNNITFQSKGGELYCSHSEGCIDNTFNTSDLFAYYKMNSFDSQNVIDYSGNDLNCSGAATVSLEAGVIGGSLNAGGGGAGITCPNIGLDGSIGIALWYMNNDTSINAVQHGIVGIVDEFLFGIYGNGGGTADPTIGTYGDNINAESCGNLPYGEWVHLYYEWNEGVNMSVYYNGVRTCGKNSVDTSADTANNLVLNTVVGHEHLREEVLIFNRSLLPNEVLDLYERGAIGHGINLSYRVSNSTPVSTNWINLGSENFNDLNGITSRYFQYNQEFTTNNINYTPELYNVTLDYVAGAPADNPAPNVTFNYVLTEQGQFNLTDGMEINISSGDWLFNTTITDTNLDNINYTIYLSGTVIQTNYSSTPININTSTSLLAVNSTYNFTIVATDTGSNVTEEYLTFTVINGSVAAVTPVDNEEDAYNCLLYGTFVNGTSCDNAKDKMGSLSLMIFVLTITAALFITPFFMKPKTIAMFVFKRGLWVLALYLMVLNSAIAATIAADAGLNLTSEMFMYMWIFGTAGYVAIGLLVLLTLKDIVATWKTNKQEKRDNFDQDNE